ncbi:solute carrier family protein [Acanthamoeba castellanii str. Neff]|uniref:Solute carrier family protein n=1 Tax=Acanthamoeba castellanii (strain ATCC 30010 / Neff) TaxID=1257118 RepID=L8GYL5_ACACF|nr:solute carrier family protein [Acanthamoeba castellanii str. Neff]ELR17603.1 solute carrier family protein [Acanthamoeba castellanii str. Neff]
MGDERAEASSEGGPRTWARALLTHKQAADFVLGGLATVTAVLFTNPIEVVKTRLQLQGELQQRVAKNKRTYRGVWHAFKTIISTEGPLAIQKGLFPAAAYQFCMNGMRLGSYSVFKQLLLENHGSASKDSLFFLKNMLAGATAGVLGAVAGSPFFLVKTRMQAQTEYCGRYVALTWGYKHRAFKSIVQAEGPRGLMRGADAAALRVGVGSSVQLPLYDNAKSLILATGWLGNNIYAHVAASLVSGVGLVVAMNPFDVVATRLYNQKVEGGKGALYRGPFDCLWKTVKAEGVYGLYKGVFAHYLRTGPHTILTFVFWEQYKKLASNL